MAWQFASYLMKLHLAILAWATVFALGSIAESRSEVVQNKSSCRMVAGFNAPLRPPSRGAKGGVEASDPSDASKSKSTQQSVHRFEFAEPHMGTLFRIVCYARDESTAKKAAAAAFARVETLNQIMSDYDPSSELMRLCKHEAGKLIKVSPELFHVLATGQRVAKESNGCFDMTIGPLVRLWRQSRLTQCLPEADELADAKKRTGYKNLVLNEKNLTVRLLVPGMRLDLGGIAKGYAADEILTMLKKHGITSAMAVAGGDIAVGDAPPNQRGWKIEVATLTNTKPKHMLLLKNAAVSTSGDKEQFTLIKGSRYSHIVDPRSGLGQTGRRMVTVIAPKGILSDSLTKAVALMAPEKAKTLIEKTPGAAALTVIQSDHGDESFQTERFNQFLIKK